MPTLTFAKSIQIHLPTTSTDYPGGTVSEILDQAFAKEPRLRSYVLDDAGALRFHLVIFVDGVQIEDRKSQSDKVKDRSHIHVIQALSGG